VSKERRAFVVELATVRLRKLNSWSFKKAVSFPMSLLLWDKKKGKNSDETAPAQQKMNADYIVSVDAEFWITLLPSLAGPISS
jgi:hypothetical protein